jgi:hypothetical protein
MSPAEGALIDRTLSASPPPHRAPASSPHPSPAQPRSRSRASVDIDKVGTDHSHRRLVNQRPDGTFNNGHKLAVGRPPGAANAVSRVLKQAVLRAAEEVGDPLNSNQDGLVGYLRWAAVHEAPGFLGLLRKIMPQTIKADVGVAVDVLSSLRGGASMNGHSAPIIDVSPKALPHPMEDD